MQKYQGRRKQIKLSNTNITEEAEEQKWVVNYVETQRDTNSKASPN